MVVKPLQSNDQTTDGVDPDSKKMQPILDNLQANILKAHGRDETYHLFLRFTGDPDKVKAWIREYAQDSHHVMSAAQQLQDTARRKNGNPNYSGGLLGCFFLSADGYKYLGFSIDHFEDSFKCGMKHREDYVIKSGNQPLPNKDPQSRDWQTEYQDEIHAMLLLAQNCREINPSLADRVKLIKDSLKGIAVSLLDERGRRLINNEGKDFEHFGYRDGISNPLFFTDEIKEKREHRYDPSACLDLVLVEDPLAGEDDCYGSYLVFRKLKQNVRTFNAQVAKLSEYVNPGNPELTGAQIVGRFKDGTPVTDRSSPQDSGADTNDFNFDEDKGFRCPIHAHIRKTNPRDHCQESRRHRIVRRGIPYGKPGDDEVGLLFMCYQSNIHDQFEFIQRVWVDNPHHPEAKTGDDPLVGQDHACSAQQKWSREWNSPKSDKTPFDFGGHVTLQGGEYFFAPSLSFLKNIHELSAIEQQLTKNLTDLNGGQMFERNVLIVATYNQEKYDVLSKIRSRKDPCDFKLVIEEVVDQGKYFTLKDEAQDIAIRLFGVPTLGIQPDKSLDEFFTFVDAFEYHPIPDNFAWIKDHEAEKIRGKLRAGIPYGWVALVRENKLGSLKCMIGWPNHPFCSVFDIQIIQLQSLLEKPYITGLRDPNEAWKRQKPDVYRYQTPTTWGP